MLDNPLDPAEVKSTFARAGGKRLSWEMRSEDGLPCLHLAVMNEVTDPEDLGAIVHILLEQGAPPTVEDGDGDTALQAVIALTEDTDKGGDGGNESPEDVEALKLLHVAAVRALLQHKAYQLGQPEVTSTVAWLRRHVPEAAQPPVLKDLEARVGKEPVAKAWSSEELLGYLERCAYDNKAGVQASEVNKFLARGAQPDHSQNGATALLLVVLNPYSKLAELQQIFKMMLEVAPKAAEMRDGFKFRPIQWASDYVNIAQQHGQDPPNPATLLALLPCLVELLPDEVDGGAACLKVTSTGQCPVKPPRGAPSARFLEGDRVLCRLETPGGAMEWEEGTVTGLWYREGCWPRSHPGAPYEVKLDIGTKYFALVDNDRIIRREDNKPVSPAKAAAAKAKGAPSPGGSGGYPAAKAKAAAGGGGSRFQRRQRPDGSWEMLDTVSGKARPCPPPDSDSDA